jgi:hypothetical protein
MKKAAPAQRAGITEPVFAQLLARLGTRPYHRGQAPTPNCAYGPPPTTTAVPVRSRARVVTASWPR